MKAINNSVQGISVVTTTWNEKENLQELIERIRKTLSGTPHEIIVVDDSSTDGTLDIAIQYADLAVGKVREGQTKGLLYGAKLSKFPVIVTIDSDLENSPELIPSLLQRLELCDVVVASRRVLPRFSERWAAKILGKKLGVSDFYSNFRAYKRETIVNVNLQKGETFGGELLVQTRKNGFKLGELCYDAPPRRSKPRIGGKIRANWRIILATWKCLDLYFFKS